MQNGEKIVDTTKIGDEELRRRADIANKQVKLLLDELKKVFAPHMLITFFVRDPNNWESFSLLTEEPDLQPIIDKMISLPKPQPLTRAVIGNA